MDVLKALARNFTAPSTRSADSQFSSFPLLSRSKSADEGASRRKQKLARCKTVDEDTSAMPLSSFFPGSHFHHKHTQMGGEVSENAFELTDAEEQSLMSPYRRLPRPPTFTDEDFGAEMAKSFSSIAKSSFLEPRLEIKKRISFDRSTRASIHEGLSIPIGGDGATGSEPMVNYCTISENDFIDGPGREILPCYPVNHSKKRLMPTMAHFNHSEILEPFTDPFHEDSEKHHRKKEKDVADVSPMDHSTNEKHSAHTPKIEYSAEPITALPGPVMLQEQIEDNELESYDGGYDGPPGPLARDIMDALAKPLGLKENTPTNQSVARASTVSIPASIPDCSDCKEVYTESEEAPQSPKPSADNEEHQAQSPDINEPAPTPRPVPGILAVIGMDGSSSPKPPAAPPAPGNATTPAPSTSQPAATPSPAAPAEKATLMPISPSMIHSPNIPGVPDVTSNLTTPPNAQLKPKKRDIVFQKGQKALRKSRSMVLNKVVLSVVLGRQLAGPTSALLKTAASGQPLNIPDGIPAQPPVPAPIST